MFSETDSTMIFSERIEFVIFSPSSVYSVVAVAKQSLLGWVRLVLSV
jgi:hypothetical protein